MPDDFVKSLSQIVRKRSQLLKQEAALWDEAGDLLMQVATLTEVVPARSNSAAAAENDHRSDKLLRAPEAAEVLGLSAQTLSKWRVTGGGPEFVKIGGRVLYRRGDLNKFIASNVKPHTSAYSGNSQPAARRLRSRLTVD